MITFFTVTGRRLDLGTPRPTDISLEDIGCALSKICRYTGQVELFYSVAQHACLVANLVDPRIAFPALHHDDSEAYLGDVSSKLKHHPEMRWFRELEAQWTQAIEDALGFASLLTDNDRHQIKMADDLAAIYERTTLRYRKDFTFPDIRRALDQQWVTHSTYDELASMVHRLPKFDTPTGPGMARAMFMVDHARHLHRWRL